MKKIYLTLLTALLFVSSNFYGQLPDGSIARNFIQYDHDSVEHELYQYLDEGKVVVLYFFQLGNGNDDYIYGEGQIQDYYESVGPDGTDEAMVFMVLCDGSTMEDLYDNYYMMNTPFPVIVTSDLNEEYNVEYESYQTPFYMICPNRSITSPFNLTNAWLQVYDDECPTYEPEYTDDINLWSIDNIDNLYCSGAVGSSIEFRNEGSEVLTSMEIVRNIDDGTFTDTVPWSGEVSLYYFEQFTLPEIEGLADGNHTLTIDLINPNNAEDMTDNNTGSKSFTTYQDYQQVDINIKLDAYPLENTWEITYNDEVLYNSPGYTTEQAHFLIEDFVCLEPEFCYTFTFNDAGGNGLTDISTGYIEILHRDVVLAEIPGNSFTSSVTQEFCVLLDSVNNLYSFSFEEQTGPAYFTNDNRILIEVENGTDITNLIANFEIDSTAVALVDDVVQESGITANDFSNIITFSVMAENGNSNDFSVEVLEAIGVNNLQNANDLVVYPNPNKGILYFNQAIDGKIQIYSITGMLVFEENMKNQSKSINISELTNGLYIIKSENKHAVQYSKFELFK